LKSISYQRTSNMKIAIICIVAFIGLCQSIPTGDVVVDPAVAVAPTGVVSPDTGAPQPNKVAAANHEKAINEHVKVNDQGVGEPPLPHNSM